MIYVCDLIRNFELDCTSLSDIQYVDPSNYHLWNV